MKQYLDDRLYPVDEGVLIRGSYRGRKKRQFNPQAAGPCLVRTLVSTANGWHRAIIIENGIERYRSPATRDREAAKALLQPVRRSDQRGT